ncbi:hypothetical protein F4808DRAFT_474875 [Astrocystis sublimbata]|nr:hypothetical protein F4808DRAFT_474875 [Astrocystis sublimbata]
MSKLFTQQGWRRTAAFNVVLACICDVILIILLIISLSQPGASLAHPSIIFEGSCTTSSRLNITLHLLINVVSTAVLASSNFFMQILSAPSRDEIDRAHGWLRSVDIGIPSIGNLSHVSRLKASSWLILLATSLPIHLFFNSSVFETTLQGSQWHLTLASEAFIHGAPFYPPGASLSPAGSLGPSPPGDAVSIGGYGDPVAIDEYLNPSSEVRKKIAVTAESSRSWTFMSAEQCRSEYMSCKPRVVYDDVLLILDPVSTPLGWTRSNTFSFDSSTNLSERWDPLVPPDTVNSLWFSTQCNTTRRTSSTDNDGVECINTCLGALGLDRWGFYYGDLMTLSSKPWLLEFFPAVRHHRQSLFEEGVNFNGSFNSMRVDHCLARKAESTCKVGLSNSLLLIVILSIFVKMVLGSVATWKIPFASIVTPGDAIESFIRCPDHVTQSLGSLGTLDAQEIEFGTRQHWYEVVDVGFKGTVQPRRWKESPRRFRHIVPYPTWVKSYSILLGAFALPVAGFSASATLTKQYYTYSLDRSHGVLSLYLWDQDKTPGYIAVLLLANVPQLILSLCYFSCNSLLTQIHVEKEWNSFSTLYKPLRVSYPKGQQVSSYRLQLPYRLSIPLILISILFHWLVSNAIFLYVNEGGILTNLEDKFAVSALSLISISYSPLFILILVITTPFFIIFPPLFFGFLKTEGNMVAGGWNSLVISAACHIHDTEANQDEEQVSDGNDSDDTKDPSIHCAIMEDEARYKRLRQLTRRRLKWGAMPVTMATEEPGSSEGDIVRHLGFGGEEHDISEPKTGEYYL